MNSLSKSSVYDILNAWLLNKVNCTIHNYDIEKELPDFGNDCFKVYHTPSTYTRGFRKLLNSPSQCSVVLKVRQKNPSPSIKYKYKGWLISLQ